MHSLDDYLYFRIDVDVLSKKAGSSLFLEGQFGCSQVLSEFGSSALSSHFVSVCLDPIPHSVFFELFRKLLVELGDNNMDSRRASVLGNLSFLLR